MKLVTNEEQIKELILDAKREVFEDFAKEWDFGFPDLKDNKEFTNLVIRLKEKHLGDDTT